MSQILHAIYRKNYSLFIWNSNLTGLCVYCVFLFAKSGNPKWEKYEALMGNGALNEKEWELTTWFITPNEVGFLAQRTVLSCHRRDSVKGVESAENHWF